MGWVGRGRGKQQYRESLCFYWCYVSTGGQNLRLREEWIEQRQQVIRKCVDMGVKHLCCVASWWAEQSLQYCVLLFIMGLRDGEWAAF